MKLKYKKIILLTTMSTMGIGLLTLSISQDRPQAKQNLSTNESIEAAANMSKEEDAQVFSLGDTMEASVLLAEEPTPIATPTPTPIPVYDLEENSKIDSFFEDYYAAKAKSDISKIKSLYSDPSQAETLEQLQKKVKFIEDYLNIKSYAKKGIEEGTYIAYAYHEIKFTNINTLAPGLSKFYLVTDDEGNLRIFSGEMDSSLREYYVERNNDEDVQELIDMTNEKSKEAKASDEDLQIFWDGVDSLANSEKTQAEGDSEE